LENLIRLGAALGIFCIMVSWETIKPRRVQQISRQQRWRVNLGLALSNMILMRVTLGGLAYTTAIMAAEHGYGLLNLWQIPGTLSIIATLLLLDFAIYAQHILMHKWPLLWRLHKAHHTDLEFDVTTALRFHPLEIILSMLYKAMCIVLIGGNPAAIVVFEIILNGAATFNHSNVKILEKVDKILRWLIITPDMHRIHHSTELTERDSNYGFSVSWWDRLCRTYTAEPKLSQITMPIGLKAYRKQDDLGLMQLLLIPFRAQNNRQD
jgi:sterol desaturase/sphingolipid hydroxylase (fatty acid hydroxylase superfamily)